MSTYHTGDEAKYDVRIGFGFGFDVTQSRLNTSTSTKYIDQIRSDQMKVSPEVFGVGFRCWLVYDGT